MSAPHEINRVQQKDKDGNLWWIVDGSKTADPITWNTKDGNFAEVTDPDGYTNGTIKKTDGELKGTWFKENSDVAPEEKVTAPTSLDGNWSKYKQSDGTYKALDQILVYHQETEKNPNTVTTSRTVNFKTLDGKILKDSKTQNATFTQSYWADSNGNPVNVKTITTAQGSMTVVDASTPMTDAEKEKAKAYEFTSGDKSFAEVNEPKITDGTRTWSRDHAEKNSTDGPDLNSQIVPEQTTSATPGNQEYTIYYKLEETPDPTPIEKTYTWTIKYQTDDGKELLPDVPAGTKFKTGDKFDADSSYLKKEITKDDKTYALVPEKSKNTKGTFKDHDEVTIFYYTLEETPVTPKPDPKPDPIPDPKPNPNPDPKPTPVPQPTTQPSEQPTVQPSETPSEQPSAQPTEQLAVQPNSQPVVTPANDPQAQPQQLSQTGEQSQAGLIGLGGAALLASFGLANRRRKNN